SLLWPFCMVNFYFYCKSFSKNCHKKKPLIWAWVFKFPLKFFPYVGKFYFQHNRPGCVGGG
ncbi:hypothetical protein ACQWHU_24995, partial [Salmonella enterica subsp. enterica serovar Infantis]